MTNEAGGISLLDHAFNAMLCLATLRSSKVDSVGMLCFSDEIHSYVPPKSGGTQMNRLLHACFDQFPRLVESRYDEAFLYLAGHCHKAFVGDFDFECDRRRERESDSSVSWFGSGPTFDLGVC